MTTTGSGAVFFLGTRAHYQVLQQPESQYDIENGNASTETIYQNPSVQDMWNKENKMDNYVIGTGDYCSGRNDVTVEDKLSNGVKRRSKRRSSETALCEDMKPATLNNVDNNTPKSKPNRKSLLTFLSSLSRRKKKLAGEQLQYLRHIESALTACTYRESCRCLDCQSRYFECDEDEEYYSSEDDSEYLMYVTQAMQPSPVAEPVVEHHDDDDEVFVDEVPDDNTSTDLLIEPKKMSVSSAETDPEALDNMNLEVAAGTPVLLNYLLTHPITCAIQ